MIKKKVWRYYCEHCGKGGCSASSMRRHELSCVYNLNRSCFLHEEAKIEQPDLRALISGLEPLSFDDGLRWLEAECSCCPACMLAAIVQSRLGEPQSGDGAWYPGFDYKEQLREWHAAACSDLNA